MIGEARLKSKVQELQLKSEAQDLELQRLTIEGYKLSASLMAEFAMRIEGQIKEKKFREALKNYDNMPMRFNLQTMDSSQVKWRKFVNEVTVLVKARSKKTDQGSWILALTWAIRIFNRMGILCRLKSEIFARNCSDQLQRCQWLKLASKMYTFQLTLFPQEVTSSGYIKWDKYLKTSIPEVINAVCILSAHDASSHGKTEAFDIYNDFFSSPHIFPMAQGILCNWIQLTKKEYSIKDTEIIAFIDNIHGVLKNMGENVNDFLVYKNSLLINQRFMARFGQR